MVKLAAAHIVHDAVKIIGHCKAALHREVGANDL